MNNIQQCYSRVGFELYKHPKLHRLMSDRMFLQQYFAQCMGYYMDFNNPKTFNEKLHWLKLHDHNPLYSTLVDKYAVKQWATQIIGEEHIIPTLQVYKSVKEIDLTQLPNQFVLKCTHDSGSVVVCSDKKAFSVADFDILKRGLKQNYYYLGREWPYKNVPRRIIAEPYLIDESGDLKDYKFFCFNGIAKLFKIDFDRKTRHRANYYDKEGTLLPFGEIVCPPDYNVELQIPSNISQMITYAERVAGIIQSPFVRIDFYNVNGVILLGEVTFYPAGGHGKFTEQGWDEKLGDWIRI